MLLMSDMNKTIGFGTIRGQCFVWDAFVGENKLQGSMRIARVDAFVFERDMIASLSKRDMRRLRRFACSHLFGDQKSVAVFFFSKNCWRM